MEKIMINGSMNEEIHETALQIGESTTHEGLFDCQLEYWLSLQSLMRNKGFPSVRKRFPNISEELANRIASANFKSLRNLCSGSISTLTPSLNDSLIQEMLEPKQESHAKMMLQVFSRKN